MTSNTEGMIRLACASDATIDPDNVPKALEVLRGGEKQQEPDEPMKGEDVASLCKCTTRTVIKYANRGLIRRIGGKGTRTRYSRKSVIAFLEGSAA